jgi:hypothetical protein
MTDAPAPSFSLDSAGAAVLLKVKVRHYAMSKKILFFLKKELHLLK